MERKVALVTGAGTGIGKETVMKLASQGCDVVACYHTSKTEAEAVVNLASTIFGVDSMVVQVDLSKEEDIHKMVEKVIERFGKIDVLVNNAALEINSDFSCKTKESFEQVLGINVIGTFLLSKLVGEIMVQNHYGKIVFVTSNNAIDQNDPTTLEYDASKMALHSIMKNLAIQFAPFVNVNAVAPGWISTEKVEKVNQELQGMLEQEESKRILLNRFGKPEEVANVISFLVSDEASYLNGEIIRVDGGIRNV